MRRYGRAGMSPMRCKMPRLGKRNKVIALLEATVICVISLAVLLFVFLGIFDGELVAGGRYGVGGRLISREDEPTRFWVAVGIIGVMSVAGLLYGLIRFRSALKLN